MIAVFDGLKLGGRYYHVRYEAPFVIQIHGYRGTAVRDFCGGNKFARESGYNSIVIDQRVHGESEGQVCVECKNNPLGITKKVNPSGFLYRS